MHARNESVLILGAGGFIGRHTQRTVRGKGVNTFGADVELTDDVDFQCDITDPDAL